MKNGIIKLGTPFAKKIGFTSDKFAGYLWKNDSIILISFIISLQEGNGHFVALVKELLKRKYTVHVPTPSMRMRKIMKEMGAIETVEEDELMGPGEILELCGGIKNE